MCVSIQILLLWLRVAFYLSEELALENPLKANLGLSFYTSVVRYLMSRHRHYWNSKGSSYIVFAVKHVIQI
jgi:hypothetical protein